MTLLPWRPREQPPHLDMVKGTTYLPWARLREWPFFFKCDQGNDPFFLSSIKGITFLLKHDQENDHSSLDTAKGMDLPSLGSIKRMTLFSWARPRKRPFSLGHGQENDHLPSGSTNKMTFLLWTLPREQPISLGHDQWNNPSFLGSSKGITPSLLGRTTRITLFSSAKLKRNGPSPLGLAKGTTNLP